MERCSFVQRERELCYCQGGEESRAEGYVTSKRLSVVQNRPKELLVKAFKNLMPCFLLIRCCHCNPPPQAPSRMLPRSAPRRTSS